MEVHLPRKNEVRRRRRGVRRGVSLEEGARGGVGLAKQNIEGSQRQNFCAGAAPPTSPDRLKPLSHPSQSKPPQSSDVKSFTK